MRVHVCALLGSAVAGWLLQCGPSRPLISCEKKDAASNSSFGITWAQHVLTLQAPLDIWLTLDSWGQDFGINAALVAADVCLPTWRSQLALQWEFDFGFRMECTWVSSVILQFWCFCGYFLESCGSTFILPFLLCVILFFWGGEWCSLAWARHFSLFSSTAKFA
jgi:hypothetical protein